MTALAVGGACAIGTLGVLFICAGLSTVLIAQIGDDWWDWDWDESESL